MKVKSQELQVLHQVIEFTPAKPASERRHVALSLANNPASLGFAVTVLSLQVSGERGSERLSRGAAVAPGAILLKDGGSGIRGAFMAAAQE